MDISKDGHDVKMKGNDMMDDEAIQAIQRHDITNANLALQNQTPRGLVKTSLEHI